MLRFTGSPKVANQTELKTAQVRIKPNAIIAEGAGGSIVWMTPSRARFMLDAGAVELLPGMRKPVGPSETPEAGPEEKKTESSDEGLIGLSTDSQPLSQLGEEESQLSSQEDLPSQERPAASSARRGRRAK